MDVYEAILDGYDIESLKRIIQFNFTDEFSSIKWDGDLRSIASDIVDSATRRGWMDDLIDALQEDNPNNFAVMSLIGGGVQAKEYSGLSDQITEVSRDIYKLRAAVFGDTELNSEGVIYELRQIKSKVGTVQTEVSRLQADVKEVRATIAANTGTLPGNAVTRKVANVAPTITMVVTILLLGLAALSEMGII